MKNKYILLTSMAVALLELVNVFATTFKNFGEDISVYGKDTSGVSAFGLTSTGECVLLGVSVAIFIIGVIVKYIEEKAERE